MLVDLRPFGVTGKVAQEALDRAGITCNKNAIPNDPEKPFVTSGLRLGTAAVTTAGMGEPEMARDRAARSRRCSRAPDDDAVRVDVLDQANRLCSKFTPYPRARRAVNRLGRAGAGTSDGRVRGRLRRRRGR